MTDTSIAEKIREKKKLFLVREQIIIDSARDLLTTQPIDKITVSEIAKRASIGKGTIYKHFQTKDEILVARHKEKLAAERQLKKDLEKQKKFLMGDVEK